MTDPISCPRCDLHLTFVGTRAFHEGRRWGVLGDLGEEYRREDRPDR